MRKLLLLVVLFSVFGASSDAHAFGGGWRKRKPKPTPNPYVTLVSAQAVFHDPVVVGGTGCPEGTASTSVAPDGSAVTFLFDQYSVAAGGANPSYDTKNCVLDVPLTLPEGIQLVITKSDYRGFNSLPEGAWSEFRWNAYLSDSRGQASQGSAQRGFSGHTVDNFTWEDTQTQFTTPCGGSANLRIDSRLSVWSNRSGEEALSSIDSLDMTSVPGVSVQVRAVRCAG